jgi:hypothetical protein
MTTGLPIEVIGFSGAPVGAPSGARLYSLVREAWFMPDDLPATVALAGADRAPDEETSSADVRWAALYSPAGLYERVDGTSKLVWTESDDPGAAPALLERFPLAYLLALEYTGSPGRTDEFERWYAESHTPFAVGVMGAPAAARWHQIRPTRGTEPELPKYLASYFFPTRQAFKAFETRLPEGAAQRRESWADDEVRGRWVGLYELIA